jgi:hypothetical protein
MVSAPLGAVSAKLTKTLFAFDGVASFEFVETFGNHSVDFFGCVFFAEVPRDHIVIDPLLDELRGVCGSAGLHFVLNKFFDLRL